MVESKFKRGEIVTVTTKSGEIKCTGIVRGWDCNLCTFEVEYEIDYYSREKDRVFTLLGVPEERIQIMPPTAKQMELINELISGSKRYGKLAIENCEKWVSAGYAGAHTTPDKLYCYCGEGNGYQGAEVTPASGIAVIYDTQEAAEATKGHTTWNGYGEKIVLEPMEAYKFFNILQADVYKAALLTIRLINLPK